MPAAVAPPPTGPGSATTTDSPAAAHASAQAAPTMPPPAIATSKLRPLAGRPRASGAPADVMASTERSGMHTCGADTVTERVALVEDQVGLGIDVSRAGDLRDNLSVLDRNRAFEDAAHDALLPPDFARGELVIGIQAGKFGAGARAAGRAVVCLAGAQHEALAVCAGCGGRAEQLDVVDLAAVRSCQPLYFEALPYPPGVIGERLQAIERQRLAVAGNQEEPVAAPGDIAVHRSNSRCVDGHRLCAAIARHIPDGHTVGIHQPRLDHTADGFEPHSPLSRASYVGERHHQPDSPMAAHV